MTEKARKILLAAKIYSVKTIVGKTYYTWTNTTRFADLEAAGGDTRAAYFVGQFCGAEERRGQAMAGPGMYVAETPLASAEYGDADAKGLLCVTIPPSVPLFNAQDTNCSKLLREDVKKIEQLKKLGQLALNALCDELKASVNVKVAAQDVFSKDHIAPILVRHAGTWLCLKTDAGVTFRRYDGAGDLVGAQALYTSLRQEHKKASENLHAQLADDIRPQIPV